MQAFKDEPHVKPIFKTRVLAALPEAYALDRCSGHARIAQLLDIAAASLPTQQVARVLEYWDGLK